MDDHNEFFKRSERAGAGAPQLCIAKKFNVI